MSSHISGKRQGNMVFLHVYVRTRGEKIGLCAILWFPRRGRSRERGGGRQVATEYSEQMGKNVGIIKMIFLTKCLHNIH